MCIPIVLEDLPVYRPYPYLDKTNLVTIGRIIPMQSVIKKFVDELSHLFQSEGICSYRNY